MSISATGNNYISQDTIDAWMASKLDDAYADMRTGMDTSRHRVDAEKALNHVKSLFAQMKNDGTDASEVTAAVNDTIKQFGDEFPDVEKALGRIADTLNKRQADAVAASERPTRDFLGNEVPPTHRPEPVHIDSKDLENWITTMTDAVDGLSQDDHLGMLNLNQLNSHINQTEQIASALIDSRNKNLDSIINRIG